MPHSCAALDCTKRCTAQTRTSGVTFHRFPKESDLRKEWVKALRRKAFFPSSSSRICSLHFLPEDFDRTGQTVRLRDGVVPSVFSFSTPPKKRRAAKAIKNSPKKQDRVLVEIPPPLPCPNLDHSYALPPSLGDLKAKLCETLERVECLEREMRNAKDRERRAKQALHVLVEDLKKKNLLNEELTQRLTSQ